MVKGTALSVETFATGERLVGGAAVFDEARTSVMTRTTVSTLGAGEGRHGRTRIHNNSLTLGWCTHP